jgi:hypothetical protein
MQIVIIAIMLLSHLLFLNCEGAKPKRLNQPLDEDSLEFVHDSFEIEKVKLPVVGLTKESELIKLYPLGPSKRKSFPNGFQKKVKSKKFSVDRIYVYSGVKNKYFENEKASGYRGLERVYFTVFVSKGIVRYYSISHAVNPKPDNFEDFDWVKGKFDTGDVADKDVWPDSQEDAKEYWKQHPENDPYR